MTNKDLESLWAELSVGRAVPGLGLGGAQGGWCLGPESMGGVETVICPAQCWAEALGLPLSLWLAFWGMKRMLGGNEA